MEIGGIAHTLAIVTKNLKIYEISASGEEPTTRVTCGCKWGSRGYPYTEEIMVGSHIITSTIMIGLWWSKMMSVLYVCTVVIYTPSYKGRYTYRVLFQHNLSKNYKYLEN